MALNPSRRQVRRAAPWIVALAVGVSVPWAARLVGAFGRARVHDAVQHHVPIPLYARLLFAGSQLWPVVSLSAFLVAFVLGLVWLFGVFRWAWPRAGRDRRQTAAGPRDANS